MVCKLITGTRKRMYKYRNIVAGVKYFCEKIFHSETCPNKSSLWKRNCTVSKETKIVVIWKAGEFEKNQEKTVKEYG